MAASFPVIMLLFGGGGGRSSGGSWSTDRPRQPFRLRWYHWFERQILVQMKPLLLVSSITISTARSRTQVMRAGIGGSSHPSIENVSPSHGHRSEVGGFKFHMSLIESTIDASFWCTVADAILMTAIRNSGYLKGATHCTGPVVRMMMSITYRSGGSGSCLSVSIVSGESANAV